MAQQQAEPDGSGQAPTTPLPGAHRPVHSPEQALRESEERLQKFMDASVEGIAFHRDGVITDVNLPMATLLGLTRTELLGRAVMDFIAPAHRGRVRQGLARLGEQPYESALLHHGGGELPVELIAREIHRDGEALRMVVVRDIRDRQAARQRMQHLAEHDALTGLRNRGAFMAALAAAIDRQPAAAAPLALLFIDLDHFKQVNDALGHLAGDALLRAVAERLLAQLRDGAVAGRFGGDEFVILLPAVAGPDAAHDAALRLQAAMAEPVAWGEQRISVTPTIGVALHPQHGRDADTLLRHADTALYAGKAAGRAAVTLFDPAMAAAASARQRLAAQVQHGLAHGEFHLMLQPRLAWAGAADARGRVAALQAGVRWHHPERGWLAPVDLAGDGHRHLLQPVLDWALREALRLAAGWQARGEGVPLALNLSALVPQAGTLAAAVGRALAQQPGAPAGLQLELPESLLAGDRLTVRRALQQLQQLGLPLWLDDFGLGGAPLAGLQQLPLAGLVIAPALAAGLPADPGAAAVLRAVTTLADGLGLQACAAGVATGEQAAALRQAGCHQLQGPWVQPPMAAAEAGAWLAARRG